VAVLIVLVLGVSLLGIVVAQVILGSERMGTSAPPPVVERPAATLVVSNARPARPVLDTQGVDVAPTPAAGGKPFTAAPALSELVHKHLGEQRGVFAVAVKDLDSGQGVLINADRELPAASLFKLPVMYEAYRQRDAGRLNFGETMTLTPEFARHDLGTLEVPVGSAVTVAWALDRMITRSDNAMANLLAERLGWTNINNTMQQLGLKETRFTGDKLTTSARDMLRLLELIALGQGLNQASSTEMLQLLLDQRINDRIPAQLPRDTPVAHKTGNLAGIVHDAGIVYSPGATFLIVVLSSEAADEGAVGRAEASLARGTYDYFNPAGATTRRTALRPPG
jgi:beta-lactamase class A